MCLKFWKKKKQGRTIVGNIKEGMKVAMPQRCEDCDYQGKDCVKLDVGAGKQICLV